MKNTYSVKTFGFTLVLAGLLAALTLNSSQAGSFIGFRDGNANVVTSGPALNRHGADDPANHNRGDDRGGRVNRHGADDPVNHDRGDDRGGHHGAGHR